MQCYPFLHVELVAHVDKDFARNHRDGFSHRMIMRGNFVVFWHFQANDIRLSFSFRVASDNGQLGSGRRTSEAAAQLAGPVFWWRPMKCPA